MQEFIKPLQIYLFIYILHKSIISFKDSKILINAIVTSMGIQVICLFWFYIIKGEDPSSLLMWNTLFLGHKNIFSIIVAQMALFWMCFSINRKSDFSILYIFLALFSLAILLYSQSMTTWIAFLFASIIILVFTKKKNKLIASIIFTCGILLLALFYSIISEKVAYSLNSLNPDYYYIPTYRLGAFYGQFLGIMENPIMGGGFQYLQFGHNGFLTTWNKLGIFGLIISFIIIIKIYKTFKFNFENIKTNYHKTLSLFGLSMIPMIPIVNLTHSFQLTENGDFGIMLILFIVYIATTRRLDI